MRICRTSQRKCSRKTLRPQLLQFANVFLCLFSDQRSFAVCKQRLSTTVGKSSDSRLALMSGGRFEISARDFFCYLVYCFRATCLKCKQDKCKCSNQKWNVLTLLTGSFSVSGSFSVLARCSVDFLSFDVENCGTAISIDYSLVLNSLWFRSVVHPPHSLRDRHLLEVNIDTESAALIQ